MKDYTCYLRDISEEDLPLREQKMLHEIYDPYFDRLKFPEYSVLPAWFDWARTPQPREDN